MSELTLTLLGSPQMARGAGPGRLRTRKCLGALAYLAVTGRAHRRDGVNSLVVQCRGFKFAV